MLEKVKMALRISHSMLDSEIEELIDAARAELIRSGVASNVANDESNALVSQAVKDYVCSAMSDDAKISERYNQAFIYIQDNLRKSTIEVAEEPEEEPTE